jgi:hypothetical protein
MRVFLLSYLAHCELEFIGDLKMLSLKKSLASLVFIFFAMACNAQSISPKDAGKYVGKSTTVCGQVVGTKYLDRGNRKPTLLDFGKPFPDQEFVAVIFDEDRSKFGEPEKACLKKDVCVTGEINIFREKPQIVVKERAQLKGCRRHSTPSSYAIGGALPRRWRISLIYVPMTKPPVADTASFY